MGNLGSRNLIFQKLSTSAIIFIAVQNQIMQIITVLDFIFPFIFTFLAVPVQHWMVIEKVVLSFVRIVHIQVWPYDFFLYLGLGVTQNVWFVFLEFVVVMYFFIFSTNPFNISRKKQELPFAIGSRWGACNRRKKTI